MHETGISSRLCPFQASQIPLSQAAIFSLHPSSACVWSTSASGVLPHANPFRARMFLLPKSQGLLVAWTPLLVYVRLFVDSGVCAWPRLIQALPTSHPAPQLASPQVLLGCKLARGCRTRDSCTTSWLPRPKAFPLWLPSKALGSLHTAYHMILTRHSRLYHREACEGLLNSALLDQGSPKSFLLAWK